MRERPVSSDVTSSTGGADGVRTREAAVSSADAIEDRPGVIVPFPNGGAGAALRNGAVRGAAGEDSGGLSLGLSGAPTGRRGRAPVAAVQPPPATPPNHAGPPPPN